MARIRNQRPYNVLYYRTHRTQEIERVRLRQEATLEFLRGLRAKPCADCGGAFPPFVMDFDHREPKTKSFNLTNSRAMLKSREQLLVEVAKCDVVCSNCHRIRTYAWLLSNRSITSSWAKGDSRYLARKRANWRAQAKALEELRDVPCADCHQRFPPFAMEFDHRDPSTKRQDVTRMVGRAGIKRILEEVAKCDIVCSNCHRVRTYRRRFAFAGVAQLVEHEFSKLGVAGSSPVSRSESPPSPGERSPTAMA